MMKNSLIAVFAGLILTANAAAAIKVDRDLAQSMDDVHSLGVVYINHNSADDSKADQPHSQKFSVITATEDAIQVARQ